jgi:hypothetical protein
MTVIFNWYGPGIPFGVLQVIPSYLGLRVIFNQAALDDAELRDPDNYTIEAIDASPNEQVHHSDAWAVTPEDVADPTYVDLDCTDLTHGYEYRLTITPSRISNAGSTEQIIGNNTADYVGVSILPRVQTVRPVSDTIMEVIFTKEVAPIAGSIDPASYSFDKGLTVREVTIIAPGTVHLLTTRQVPSELYTLTVS